MSIQIGNKTYKTTNKTIDLSKIITEIERGCEATEFIMFMYQMGKEDNPHDLWPSLLEIRDIAHNRGLDTERIFGWLEDHGYVTHTVPEPTYKIGDRFRRCTGEEYMIVPEHQGRRFGLARIDRQPFGCFADGLCEVEDPFAVKLRELTSLPSYYTHIKD